MNIVIGDKIRLERFSFVVVIFLRHIAVDDAETMESLWPLGVIISLHSYALSLCFMLC